MTLNEACQEVLAQKTVLVDLDGVLADSFDGNWEHINEPRKYSKEAMQMFRDQGWQIIVFTCRPNARLVHEWLLKHEITFDSINVNKRDVALTGTVNHKPFGHLILDDTAYPYCGHWFPPWGEIIADLEARGILTNPNEPFLKFPKYAANFYGETCKR